MKKILFFLLIVILFIIVIINNSYDEKYGARPMKRAVQTEVEDTLAEEILKGNVAAGDTVRVTIRKGQIHYAVK